MLAMFFVSTAALIPLENHWKTIESHGKMEVYLLVITDIAIENGHGEFSQQKL